jgi:hypothetical protein
MASEPHRGYAGPRPRWAVSRFARPVSGALKGPSIASHRPGAVRYRRGPSKDRRGPVRQPRCQRRSRGLSRNPPRARGGPEKGRRGSLEDCTYGRRTGPSYGAALDRRRGRSGPYAPVGQRGRRGSQGPHRTVSGTVDGTFDGTVSGTVDGKDVEGHRGPQRSRRGAFAATVSGSIELRLWLRTAAGPPPFGERARPFNE